MTTEAQKELDRIDDAVDFVVHTRNQTIVEANRNNTVIKADSREDIVTFCGISLGSHEKYNGGFYRAIQKSYPLLELVMIGLELEPPNTLYYQQGKMLIAEFNDCVIGVAPMADKL